MAPRTELNISFEFFPPKTDKGVEKLRETVRELASLGPDFVSVTFGAGGSTREKTYETVMDIRRTAQLDAAPHLSCIGSRKENIRAYLERYRDSGIRRIIALRGDVPEDQAAFHEGGFRYANELVGFIKEFGGFDISVACYPDYHPEASDPISDLERFCAKARAGADSAITQYFFNNAAYYDFVEQVRRRGIDIPIVVGLMPITNFAQIASFSERCGADIPLWLKKRMRALGEDVAAQAELGIELATRQVEDLLENGAPGIHFYTLNKAEATRRICENLGLVR